jgi:hypothetical protein
MKRIFTLALLLVLLLTACDHKELCYDHDSHAMSYSVRFNFQYDQVWHEDYSYYLDTAVDVDGGWVVDSIDYYDQVLPELTPQVPQGIRCLLYNADGERRTYNFGAQGGTLSMSKGEHQFLFFNNDSEYIVFTDEPEAAEITLTTRSRSRSTYQGSPYLDTGTRAENTVSPPDMLYFSYVDSYTATKASLEPDTLDVPLRPLVCTYVVKCNFLRGGQYVVLARGALAGMAGSVRLYNGETIADDVATVLFDMEVHAAYAHAQVNTFGVPGYELDSNVYNWAARTRVENTYGLNLELRLVNGDILTYDFDVTDQVALQPQGGVITIDGIEIDEPESVSNGSSSGFDVTVDGWGEYQDYTLPIN